MIEKQVTFEGVLREEENEQNGFAWHGLVMADFTGRDGQEQSWAIDIKPGGNPLGSTTIVTALAMSVSVAITDTVSLKTTSLRQIAAAANACNSIPNLLLTGSNRTSRFLFQLALPGPLP